LHMYVHHLHMYVHHENRLGGSRRSLKNTPDPQLTSCAIALVVSTSGLEITC
jgi:hypothetical protein